MVGVEKAGMRWRQMIHCFMTPKGNNQKKKKKKIYVALEMIKRSSATEIGF